MPVFSLPPWVRRLWVPCLWLLLWQGAALLAFYGSYVALLFRTA